MKNYKFSFVLATIVLIIATSMLLSRLWYLQIIKGGEFDKFSRINRIRIIKLPAPRGRILDRKGRALVTNRQSFDVFVNAKDVVDAESFSKNLSFIIGIDPAEIKQKLDSAKRSWNLKPVLIVDDVNRDQLAYIETRKSDTLAGVDIHVNHIRKYPYGNLAAHVLGYVGKLSEQELNSHPEAEPDDFIGKIGVENSYESYLKGKRGVIQKATDALGREVKGYPFQDDLLEQRSEPGSDIVLTLDIDLQSAAEKAIAEHKGVVIAMNVNTGEILALVSSPGFTPSDFTKGIEPDKWRSLQKDRSFPLLNRATQGLYPPGSVFKIVTAVAALEQRVVDPETTHFCPGYHSIGTYTFRCWKHSGHGKVNMRKALRESCDVYFYKAAEKIGIDVLSKYMKAFGFGNFTGIDLIEKKGISPDRKWKMQTKNLPWYSGDTIMTAIGQGYLSVTPLQVAAMTAALANGGTVFKPTLIRRVIANDGIITKEIEPEILRHLNLSVDTVNEIKSGLEAAVNDYKGTGRGAMSEHIIIAGKTGTAQVVSSASKQDIPEHNNHAWFTSYAPSSKPEIVVTVLVEHGGGGGEVAAPIAKEVIEQYFRIKQVAQIDSDRETLR